jgi:hypothetical protein
MKEYALVYGGIRHDAANQSGGREQVYISAAICHLYVYSHGNHTDKA